MTLLGATVPVVPSLEYDAMIENEEESIPDMYDLHVFCLHVRL